MKKLPKTRIIQVQGAEVYFTRHTDADGTIFWEEYRKDKSGLLPYRDTKFRSMGHGRRGPAPMIGDASRGIPEDFATSLLSPFARLEYAPGHKPAEPLRF